MEVPAPPISWIEHSGTFERAYRIQNTETTKPSYLVIEVQTERQDEELPRRFLVNYMEVNLYAHDDVGDNVEEEEEYKGKGTLMNKGYYVYPVVLCPFPQSVPPPINETFQDEPLLTFNFRVVGLWEKDAREALNTHVSAIYYLLPAMKNADAALLGLAIGELVQRFQGDDTGLGRHLTGLHLMLQESEMMSEEEKLATQERLKPFAHLIKNDPLDE